MEREHEQEYVVCGGRVFSAHADGVVYCVSPECLTAPVPAVDAPCMPHHPESHVKSAQFDQ